MKVTREDIQILKVEGLSFRDVETLIDRAYSFYTTQGVHKLLIVEKFSDGSNKFHGPFNTLSELEKYVRANLIESLDPKDLSLV